MLAFASLSIQAQVGIGVAATSVQASAVLEVKSTTKVFLPPRMSGSQRNSIASPAAGIIIWCTDCGATGELQVYNGSSWTNMIGGTTSAIVIPPITTIGSQVWTNVNLDVAQYRNGDPIPKVEDYGTWMSLTTGAYCYYNNDSATYAAKYGKLYNWYAINDSRGLAPVGYHVPTRDEWNTLIATLGGTSSAGNALKEVGTTYWNDGTGATNSSGFSARGGGFRDNNTGNFLYEKTFGYFWDATAQGGNTAYYHSPESGSGRINQNPYPYTCGFSVRLIKD